VLTVVKVGGGLAREAGDDALRALCAALGAAGERHPLLVVPGGGELADAVRAQDRRLGLRPRTAHWMAILAMDAFGWALADLIPGAALSPDLPPTGDPGVTVLLPYAVLRGHDALPESWAVTSDTIAAWVAGRTGAARLVLVKPVDGLYREWPPTGDAIAALTVDELAALRSGGVDAQLATALRDARVEAWVIGGRDPARLTELLDTGRTSGTRIAPA
jgi:5-(aminomethyl)-3-furanmethanol phosphate kinase